MLANRNLFFHSFVGKNLVDQYDFKFLLSDLLVKMSQSPAMQS